MARLATMSPLYALRYPLVRGLPRWHSLRPGVTSILFPWIDVSVAEFSVNVKTENSSVFANFLDMYIPTGFPLFIKVDKQRDDMLI